MSNHAVGLRKVRTFAGVSTERRKQEGKYGVERAARGTVFGIVPYFVHVSVYTSVKKICPDDRQSRDCQILHGFSVPVKCCGDFPVTRNEGSGCKFQRRPTWCRYALSDSIVEVVRCTGPLTVDSRSICG